MHYEIKILSEHFKTECNASAARLSELFANSKAPFELAYFQLAPHTATIAHDHDEQEVFICLKGSAKIQLNSQAPFFLKEEEILFVEKNQTHQIINDSDERITMLSIWWHTEGISYRERQRLLAHQGLASDTRCVDRIR